jgi:hypothetical protein
MRLPWRNGWRLWQQQGKVWKGSPDTLRKVRGQTVKGAARPWKHNALRHSFISYRLPEIQNAAQAALAVTMQLKY